MLINGIIERINEHISTIFLVTVLCRQPRIGTMNRAFWCTFAIAEFGRFLSDTFSIMLIRSLQLIKLSRNKKHGKEEWISP